MITKKTGELDQVNADLEGLNQQYLGMAELQNSIRDAAEYQDKIEEAKVRIQMMNV